MILGSAGQGKPIRPDKTCLCGEKKKVKWKRRLLNGGRGGASRTEGRKDQAERDPGQWVTCQRPHGGNVPGGREAGTLHGE